MEFPCQMCLTWMTWKCLTWSSMSNAFDMEIPCQIWHSHFSNDLKIHWHGNSMSNLKLTLLETAFDMEIPCQTCNDETAFDMEFPCQMWFFPLTWKFHVKYVFSEAQTTPKTWAAENGKRRLSSPKQAHGRLHRMSSTKQAHGRLQPFEAFKQTVEAF